MRRTLALTLPLLALLAPAAAEAATVHVVRGAGFGHGIGMSQYGAYGFAQQGFGYQRILAHYYGGTKLEPAPSRPVRVLLQASRASVRFVGAGSASGGATASGAAIPSGGTIPSGTAITPAGPGAAAGAKRLDPRVTHLALRASGGRISLVARGKRVGTFTAPLRVTQADAPLLLHGRALNGISGGTYRGSLELRPGAAGGVTAVNSLPLDSYVQGVVPGEMPSSWALDALRAQAVAARTYALATRKLEGVFDQFPDTRSQVYRGVRAETARTNKAVADTAGKILTYAGQPAVTYYFSTSGGRTENVELSFLNSEPKPWLKSVEDPYDDISPKHRWRFRFTPAQLGARLGAPGRFRKVRVVKRGRSPRIVHARVYGSGGSLLLTGAQIRARLKLHDSWAYFTKVSTTPVKPPEASAARMTPSPFPELKGAFEPPPRSRRALVERRGGGRWERVGEVSVSDRGRYRSTLAVPGVYRVRSGGVTGPAVRVPTRRGGRTRASAARPSPPHATAASPLAVLATGDSIMQIVDSNLARLLEPGGKVKVHSDARISTGISKPNLLDWLRHAAGQARRLRPRATVVFLGANDGFPLGAKSGRRVSCCGRAWSREYARRARQMMVSYARGGAGRVYWLLLPQAREGFFGRVYPAVNAGVRRAARGLAGVRVIHLNRVFTPGGRYSDYVTHRGRRVLARQRDGIHLSYAGAAIAAEIVVRAMRADRVL